jgi:hypothetical protein
MVDIGDEHFVATHDVKDLLIWSLKIFFYLQTW